MPITSPLESKIKRLSDDPGVYLMKDAMGQILYVGKAKNLKARVASYFNESKDKAPRTELLVRKISDFDVVLTDNEVEALVLECNLIKKHKPRFNVLLKDDKNYPYVRLNLGHPFPRIEYTRNVRKERGDVKYFGPYVSSFQIKDVLRWAQKAFQLRDCSDNEFRNRARPCILHQMGQCSAPCVGLITEKDYGERIQDALKILNGKTTDVVKKLKAEMLEASEKEEFEKAASLRDRISHIEDVNEDQKITNVQGDYDRDVVHYARKGEFAVIVVMHVRQGRTIGVSHFPFTTIEPAISDAEALSDFLAQFYLRQHEQNPQLLPGEVLLPALDSDAEFKAQAALLSRALGRRVDFRIPKRGEAADLVAMVLKTAEYHLNELVSKHAQSMDDLQEVKRKLKLEKYPHRIECFDISHFQGEGTVASRVVFIEGKPDKALYRHYHVREVEGVDDFMSMREIIGRRFENDSSAPDLVVVDGGKGQLAQAEAIFQELGVTGVELVSIAKARTERDFTATEVEATLERIFKPGQKNPIALKPGTGPHRILTQARDEAHRFAITFHRSVRDKQRKG